MFGEAFSLAITNLRMAIKKIRKAEKMSCGPVLTSEAQSEIKGNKAF